MSSLGGKDVRSDPLSQLEIGAVVIGRNEGLQLERCLLSLRTLRGPVVYVDSGSTDNSVELAASLGCKVVVLNPENLFTAAAARNAGFNHLMTISPDCGLVQLVDGDCEVAEGWIQHAAAFLSANHRYAIACGRRRERHPENSLYNRLCDLEWSTPVGDADACGGDALVRAGALQSIGGFDARLIAGEEPEMCSRLRRSGWGVMRLDCEMTLHDANIRHIWQWWRRSKRAGWAFISGAMMESRAGHRRWVREALRPWLWCLLIPSLAIVLSLIWGWWSLIALFPYLLIIGRSAHRIRKSGEDWCTAIVAGALGMLGKFAELQGQLNWLIQQFSRQAPRLIEYKEPASPIARR